MGQESPAVACRSALGTRGYSGCGCRRHPSEGSMALLFPTGDTEHIAARALGTRLRINSQSPRSSGALPKAGGRGHGYGT
jgi:hypothetical protein